MTSEADLSERVIKLEAEIANVKLRNARVELDKAWETSRARVLTICVITYCVAVAFMYAIGTRNPWVDALVPTGGFFLSTQSLSVIKNWWIHRRQASDTQRQQEQ
jgi:hypothetical protein